MKRMHPATTSLVIVGLAVAAAMLPASAEPPTGAAATPLMSNATTAYASLPGRWVRPDGGYVISIKSVDASGKLDASYANPNPLPFYTAMATNDGTTLKLFFELRAGGYEGSTYTLSYNVAGDELKGTYYQAVAKQTFEVVFVRK
jgi:hypothetical protein